MIYLKIYCDKNSWASTCAYWNQFALEIMLLLIPILVLKLCLPRPDVIHVSFIQCKKLIDMWCCCCFFLIDSASLVCLHVFGIYVVLVCSGFVSFVCFFFCLFNNLWAVAVAPFVYIPFLLFAKISLAYCA